VRALAIGLSKALESVHVKHEVLGYHAPVCEEMRQMPTSTIYTRRSNRLETLVVKESGQKDQLGLMNLEPQLSDNSDGESLRIALKRVKMMRAKSHMIFVISDGKPFLCDTDMSVLDQDLREALKKAAREKVKVYGLGFFDQLGAFFDEHFCNASEEKDVLSFFEKLN
jgi:nitric oxide reductase activation protein